MNDELKLKEEWMAKAKEQTLETLPDFLKMLAEQQHDYGTICHAIAAAGIGAMWALEERSPAGGISGFQAGCIMWDVIDGWGTFDKGPKQMLCFSNLLYPQYAKKFCTISKSTWDWAQAEAKKNIEEKQTASDRVHAHWQTIANGTVPFGLTVLSEEESL